MKNHIYNHQNIPLPMTSLGVSTSRFKTLLLQEGRILLPVTSSLAVYDLNTLNQISQKQTNQSVIYCMVQNEQYVFTIGYGGDITQMDRNTLNILQHVNLNIGNQCRWASICGNRLVYSTERSNHKGTVQVVDIDTLNPIISHQRRYYGTLTKKGDQTLLYMLQEQKSNKLKPDDKSVLTQKELLKHKHNHKYTYTIEVYIDDTLIKQLLVDQPPGEIMLMAQSEQYLAYVYSDRRVLILNLETDDIEVIQFEGVGQLQAVFVDGDQLIISLKTGIMTYYSIKSKETNHQKVQGLTELVSGIYKNNDALLITTESEIVIELPNKQTNHKQFGTITKCGLDFHKTGLACGDFEGNVTIYPNCSQDNQMKVFIGVPVRSLASHGDDIIVGTMCGSLYKYSGFELTMIDELEGSITCIRSKGPLVMASTTNGIVAIYKGIERILHFQAHQPKQASEGFGSLGKYAEVWSTAFHPLDDRIATGSEDQSVRVFRGQQLLAELVGHKNAVTCLDWKLNHDQQVILYSCSDDRTIRMYNATLELISVIDTLFINEWHTLTYMAVKEVLQHQTHRMVPLLLLGLRMAIYSYTVLCNRSICMPIRCTWEESRDLQCGRQCNQYNNTMINLHQSKQKRLEYEQQLYIAQQKQRQDLLKYYQNTADQRPRYLKVISSHNSLRIPKTEQSAISCRNSYQDMMNSNLKLSQLQDSISTIKQSQIITDQLCLFTTIQKIADQSMHNQLQSWLRDLKQAGRVIRFVLANIQKKQQMFFDALIRNYNKQVLKQQYEGIVLNFRDSRALNLKSAIINQLAINSKQTKHGINYNLIRQHFQLWKCATHNNKNKATQATLSKAFKAWMDRTEYKKQKSQFQFKRKQQLFYFLYHRCQDRKDRIHKLYEAKDLIRRLKQQLIINVLKIHTEIVTQEKEFSMHYNEFLPKQSNIKVIKL